MTGPRALYPEPGAFAAPRDAAVHHPPAAAPAAALVAARTGLSTRQVERGEGWWVVAGTSATPAPAVPDRPDGFALTVMPHRVELAGRNSRALGYAAASLAGDGLDCRRLVDFADLAVRGMHLDLKGPALAASYLDSLIHRLGAGRINTLLVEYEDRFPYPPELDLAAEHTVDVSALLSAADRHGMTVIPLVQCLGHLEYALRRPRWSHLAEDHRRQQLCPMRPESLEFLAAALDAVVSAHPAAEHVHIGGDEPWSLGRCPRCATVPRGDLYVRHIAAAARLVVERGRRPVVWDDMLYAERDPALADALPPETEVMAWEYAADGPHGWARWGNPQTLVSTSDRLASAPPGAPLAPVGSLPPAERRLIGAVKSGEHPLPWARALVARGRPVIGAAAVRGADGENVAYPSWGKRLANVRMWAQYARSLGLTGLVSTAWSAYDTVSPPTEPLPTADPLMTAAAQLCWNADAPAELPDWCRVVEHGTPHELHALSETDPLVRACARHRLLALQTDRVAPVAAWHGAAARDDPAAAAARAAIRLSVDELRGQWLEWRSEYADAVRHVYAGDGAGVVAAAKAAEPLRRLEALR